MKTPDAYNLILFIEKNINIDVFEYNSFKTWPILRILLYNHLINVHQSRPRINILINALIKFFQFFDNKKTFKKELICNNTKIKKIFFSRPVYLVDTINQNGLFDRVIDPIIMEKKNKGSSLKLYTSKLKKGIALFNQGYDIQPPLPFLFFNSINFSDQEVNEINKISKLSGLNNSKIKKSFKVSLIKFSKWYQYGKNIFRENNSLREIYLVAWYFPDMMGICAAASEAGIPTIDIQHGKQGIFQACYSGWQKIPKDGYDLVPDFFWCWGKPSCDHILRDSPNRKKHTPFVGGYPWIKYYKTHLCKKKFNKHKNKIRVVVTLQTLGGLHVERIPDFIVNFLINLKTKMIHFNFKIHPNDHYHALEYTKNRLKNVNKDLYSIDSNEVNLYDTFMNSTHHITACSSCCYEAQAFGLSTLLFGQEAKEIYDYEIRNNIFAWTVGNKKDLDMWLRNNKKRTISKNKKNYITI